ncbi:unnamed protein product [Cylindrotheca closterium]|uniref:CSD domain-containing protein n=1 Tax=Cylindrotheca closterium TaxID=2856 RepID=A0AAD2FTR1_9STRA|nr:unnamed protein product [Cylindrotheca closterium]
MFRSFLTSSLRVSSNFNRSNPIRCFSDAVSSGTVKWFDSKKGFGFIVPDDGSEDVFVHQTAVHAEGFRSLGDGEPVEFSVVVDNNGRSKAENVTGPMGAFVQGAPRSPRFTNDDGSFGGNDFGGNDFGNR